MRLIEESASTSQAGSLSSCPRRYRFENFGRRLSSRQNKTRTRTGLLLLCTGRHALQQHISDDLYCLYRQLSLIREGAIESDSLYTIGDPAMTRQRLFGDIAPVYDEVGLSRQTTALKGLGLEPLVIEH